MPCHPHQLMRPCAALPSIASVLLRKVPRRGAVVGREAACGIAADNLLTGQDPQVAPRRDEPLQCAARAGCMGGVAPRRHLGPTTNLHVVVSH
jgi:hypothetical protein